MEVLIAAELRSITFGVVAAVLVSSIRASFCIVAIKQALDERGRIATFIKMDVGEASAEGAMDAIHILNTNPCNAGKTDPQTMSSTGTTAYRH